jgi:hypothetical protein
LNGIGSRNFLFGGCGLRVSVHGFCNRRSRSAVSVE